MRNRLLPLLFVFPCVTGAASAQDKAIQIVAPTKQGISCSKRDAPVFPREALRKGIQRGRVSAVLTIDENGNVADVRIVSSDPPKVFDRATRDAVMNWKCKAEGSKYEAPVDLTFTLQTSDSGH
jgi:TonB family protein